MNACHELACYIVFVAFMCLNVWLMLLVKCLTIFSHHGGTTKNHPHLQLNPHGLTFPHQSFLLHFFIPKKRDRNPNTSFSQPPIIINKSHNKNIYITSEPSGAFTFTSHLYKKIDTQTPPNKIERKEKPLASQSLEQWWS